jgi:hypothetical protein
LIIIFSNHFIYVLYYAISSFLCLLISNYLVLSSMCMYLWLFVYWRGTFFFLFPVYIYIFFFMPRGVYLLLIFIQEKIVSILTFDIFSSIHKISCASRKLGFPIQSSWNSQWIDIAYGSIGKTLSSYHAIFCYYIFCN